ncbi:MAG: YbjQ family protein [Ferruginibacter sp.]|nr:YbjQ family protein [Ferruginibacter sp.]
MVLKLKCVKTRLPLKKNTMIDLQLITTANNLEGYRISKHLGVVRGITVRSRSLLGNIGGGIQSLFGGKLSIYVQLCETTREEAYRLMIQNANDVGANAVINMRYDANEVMQGITEVLAYGTAVVVEKVN